MEPLKTYEYLSRARAKLLDRVRPLTEEQYTRQFPIGLGSLARTLTHIMMCEWFYVRRMLAEPVPPYAEWPIQDEHPPTFAALKRHWIGQADVTRGALRSIRDWSTPLEYRVQDEGRATIVTATRGDIFTQLAFHEVHHRAQAMNILRQLGSTVDELDYNTLMYTRREG